MQTPEPLRKALNRHVANSYEYSNEDAASASHGEFLRQFPRSGLEKLTMRQYVLGHQEATFCWYLEVRTRPWAAIAGATSLKFGVYYGRTSNDEEKKYRSAAKFDEIPERAFPKVRKAIIALLSDGDSLDFAAIDKNPLSQLFKAKILSLYLPKQYLSVCSEEHLWELADTLGLEAKFTSEIQHLLIAVKDSHPTTSKWSNPKFMSFLYDKFVYQNEGGTDGSTGAQTPTLDAKHKKVDWDAINAGRKARGIVSEAFAMQWEKDRLRSLGRRDLIKNIEDRSDRPGFGYDIRSFEGNGAERHIEVKSIALSSPPDTWRFFLTSNELKAASRLENSYFFYFVNYDDDGDPVTVTAIKADELLAAADKSAELFLVRFDMKIG